MLRCEHVRLRQGTFCLDADLAVPEGAHVAVIGPSGAGKSTLLAAIAGFLTPEAGRIWWDERDITDIAPGERPMSVVFQDQNLFPHLTVAQNVGLGLSPALKLTVEDRDRVTDVLRRVGLAGLEARRPAELSGGQASRVALARALARARRLVLLDEPFSALGPALRAEMLDLVADMFAGVTLMMVTHDPADARRIANCAILVAEGRAAAPVPVNVLLDDPPEVMRAYFGGAG